MVAGKQRNSIRVGFFDQRSQRSGTRLNNLFDNYPITKLLNYPILKWKDTACGTTGTKFS